MVSKPDLRWTPIVAVRGQGMLIDGNRIGLYNQCKMQSKSTGKETHWGVMYLMLTEVEWEKLRAILYVNAEPPFDITFVSDSQPNDCTVSRAYLSAFAEIDSEKPWFIGWATHWGPAEIPYSSMQDMIIKMADWVKANVADSGV